jgi:ring-1,2-phenylacetyl-CoA epoxidase subunit PaaC
MTVTAMTDNDRLFQYLLRLGDSPLILAQRLGEWVGHGPILEEDIAQANVGLDLLGQARLWLTYAGEVEARFALTAAARTSSRFLRDSGEFRKLLARRAAERQFRRYDRAPVPVRHVASAAAGHARLLARCTHRRDRRQGGEGSGLSRRAIGRLGDPVGRWHRESHAKMQAAIDDLWMYTGEMFTADAIELG